MLQVDLGQLDRRRRLRIGASIPADDAMWTACQSAEWTLGRPVDVQLEAQRVGSDVVVRGTVAGVAELLCRRCLTPVRSRFAEDVTFVFQAGMAARDAEDQETYALPPRVKTVDLTEAVREHVLLGLPRFALCDEACRGLCSHCGKNLNHGACECAHSGVDDRWAALRRLAQH